MSASRTTDLTSDAAVRAALIARAVIVSVAALLALYTWGHWGDVQIDCGREMYVPVGILRGKLLYRDLWYNFGPLVPYVEALLFRIFGIDLNVLYVFGVALTMGFALLTYEVTRRFTAVPSASLAPSLFFLFEAFGPTIFNYVFPYSYAASMGSLLGMACLYFAIAHAFGGRSAFLGLAALCAGLALLSKQEFGLACLVLLGFSTTTTALIRRSAREFGRSVLWCLPGLSFALAGYGWFIWKVSARTLLVENLVSTPGSYYMRTLGRKWVADRGMRFVPNELIHSAVSIIISIAVWFAVSSALLLVMRKGRLLMPLLIAASALAALLLVAIARSDPGGVMAKIVLWCLWHVAFPQGIFFLSCFFLLSAVWKLWKAPGFGVVAAEILLGIYATALGVRVMMKMWAPSEGYALFYNVPIFLIFVVFMTKLVGRTSSPDARHRDLVAFCLLGVETLFLGLVLFPQPEMLPTRLRTEFGTIYTKHDMGMLFPEIISFMKTHTKNGRDILVLPESASLYFFAGMQPPSRWYELPPGIIDPREQTVFVRDIVANNVRFVLIDNRDYNQYGVAPFGVGYDQRIYQWIQTNYTKIGQFGPLPDESRTADRPRVQPRPGQHPGDGPYIMSVFERKPRKWALP